jgi:hypothetical protein
MQVGSGAPNTANEWPVSHFKIKKCGLEHSRLWFEIADDARIRDTAGTAAQLAVLRMIAGNWPNTDRYAIHTLR